MPLFGAVDPWAWQPHPEVWFLLLAVLALGYYAAHVIGPKVVRHGRVVSRRNIVAFAAAWVLLWLAADWPMHDIAEDYLYSVHMVQHFLLTFVIPPLFLLATPGWLMRLVIEEDSAFSSALRRLTHPVVAGLFFNAVVALGHWTVVVNTSVDSGAFHYGVHLLTFFAAMLMWTPVVGPVEEYRLGPFSRLVYLFAMTIIPTIPAAWLTFADGAVYQAYDHADRLWGVDVVDDQQWAGLIMKLVAGMYIWAIITVLFFTWAGKQRAADRANRVVLPRIPDSPAELVEASSATSGRPDAGA